MPFDLRTTFTVLSFKNFYITKHQNEHLRLQNGSSDTVTEGPPTNHDKNPLIKAATSGERVCDAAVANEKIGSGSSITGNFQHNPTAAERTQVRETSLPLVSWFLRVSGTGRWGSRRRTGR